MALRNYTDPIPLAGVSTTTTAKFGPTSDGTTALIPFVTLVDQAGAAVTPAAGTSATPSVGVEQGSASIATAQVTVASTTTAIVTARATRREVTITNAGTTPVYIGGVAVTTANGTLLPGVLGASITIPTTAAVSGIVAAGTQAVTVLETY